MCLGIASTFEFWPLQQLEREPNVQVLSGFAVQREIGRLRAGDKERGLARQKPPEFALVPDWNEPWRVENIAVFIVTCGDIDRAVFLE